MVVKKFMLCISLLCGAPLVQASAPAREQGVLSALASDAVSVVKWVGTGIGAVAQGIGNTYLLAREYPKTALAIAVAVPVLGKLWYEVQYEEHIKPVIGRANSRRCVNWQIETWKNSAALSKSLPAATNRFEAEFCGGQRVNREQVAALTREIESISQDMKELENKYLVCRAPLGITLYDIRKEFEDACKGSAELALSTQAFDTMQSAMGNEINGKIMPYLLLSVNYRQAAKAWLELKIKQLRLKVLAARLNEIVTGRANDASLKVELRENQAGVHLKTSHDPA